MKSWLFEWELVEFLGSGSYGGVYKTTNSTRNEHSAVKITYIQQNQQNLSIEDIEKVKARMRKEFLVIRGKEHENIVNAYEYLETELKLPDVEQLLKSVLNSEDREAIRMKHNFNYLATGPGPTAFFIRMELCGINLRQWIESFETDFDQTLWTAQRDIIKGILRGIRFLHYCKILHRDLKSENIFLAHSSSTSCHVKIGDFGISRMIHSEDSNDASALTMRPSTTPMYRAPELLTDTKYTLQADLYSLGLVIFEILLMLKCNDRPTKFKALKERNGRFITPTRPFQNAFDVVQKLTEIETEKRMGTIEDVKLILLLENRVYSAQEFANILSDFPSVTGNPEDRTVITDYLKLSLDNCSIHDVQFRCGFDITGNMNNISHFVINPEAYSHSSSRITGSDNVVNDAEFEKYYLYVHGDRNTVSNVSRKQSTNGKFSINVGSGKEHTIQGIRNLDCDLHLGMGTSFCNVENVNCNSLSRWGGKNHAFKNVQCDNLKVQGEGHMFSNCRVGISKCIRDTYEFNNCSIEITNQSFVSFSELKGFILQFSNTNLLLFSLLALVCYFLIYLWKVDSVIEGKEWNVHELCHAKNPIFVASLPPLFTPVSG